MSPSSKKPITRCRRAVVALAVVATTILSLGPCFGKQIYLNVTDSVPVGLYLLSTNEGFEKNDLLLLRRPHDLESLAQNRPWLRTRTVFLKRLQGRAGDRFCATEQTFTLAERTVPVAANDRDGEPLPHLPSGCQEVPEGAFIVLGDNQSSFDSRYFGPVDESLVIGKAIPIFVWS